MAPLGVYVFAVAYEYCSQQTETAERSFLLGDCAHCDPRIFQLGALRARERQQNEPDTRITLVPNTVFNYTIIRTRR